MTARAVAFTVAALLTAVLWVLQSPERLQAAWQAAPEAPPLAPAPLAPQAEAEAPPAPDAEALLARAASIAARPLFNPTRRRLEAPPPPPPVPVRQPAVAPPVPQPVRDPCADMPVLHGLAHAGGVGRAIVGGAGGAVTVVKPGEAVGPWRIERIENGKLIARCGDSTQDFVVEKY